MIHIVLFEPEIPQNTANIGRLCVCNDFCLHLIEPLGFRLDEKKVKRAGLDYWQHLNLIKHKHWSSFLEMIEQENKLDNLFFFSAKGEKSYWQQLYTEDVYLLFGSERKGLPQEIHYRFKENFLNIPMQGKNSRCLNLSSSVSIASYEVLRQKNNHKMYF